MVLLESVTNPDYPNQPQTDEGGTKPGEYPPWRSVQPAWPGAANAEHGTKYGAARPAAPAAMAAPRKSRRETGFDSFITSDSL